MSKFLLFPSLRNVAANFFFFFFGRHRNLQHFLWAVVKANFAYSRLLDAATNLDILPLRDYIENQSISTPSFLLRRNHVVYISARPQEDLLQINLSAFIGLVKTSVRFSFVWIFCKSTLPSSTTSRTK